MGCGVLLMVIRGRPPWRPHEILGIREKLIIRPAVPRGGRRGLARAECRRSGPRSGGRRFASSGGIRPRRPMTPYPI